MFPVAGFTAWNFLSSGLYLRSLSRTSSFLASSAMRSNSGLSSSGKAYKRLRGQSLVFGKQRR